MAKKKKYNYKKVKKTFFIVSLLNAIGQLTLKLMRIFVNSCNKILLVIIKIISLPFLLFKLVSFILEKVGHLTLFFIVNLIHLPSLPFLMLWELWLVSTSPAVRKQRLTTLQKNLKIKKKNFSLFWKNSQRNFANKHQSLARHPDPGVQFCYVFVRTPLRLAVTLVIFSSLIFNFYFWVLKDLPSPYKLKKPPAVSTKIYARDCSTLLYKIYRDQNRTLIPLKDIPLHVKQATISIEDKEFYQHHGYSLKGIVRAFRNNLANRNLQGGSTITQQLIKNTVLSSERTYERKIKELILSLQTELIFSKDQILQMYLNEVAYGGPAYGIEEASQMYFGKTVKEVDLAEAAFLAGLPAAPSEFSPYLSGIKKAKERQKKVLKQMVATGFVNLDEAKKAYQQNLKILPPLSQIKAPHFVMYARRELEERFGKKMIEEEGLNVCTTLDPKIQEMAEKIVEEEVGKIKDAYHVNNGAALITNPKTGEILAMVGSVDYWDKENDGNVNLTTSRRQPGSSIKLVNYAYGLAHNYITPNSVLMDTPVSYSNAWETYTPVNYDHKFKGPVTVRTALAESRNVPAVKLLNSYGKDGPDQMRQLGQKMGITSWDDLRNYGLSITLGAAEVKMTEMATVYGTIANLGKKVPVTPFKKIADVNGKILQDLDASDPLLKFAREAQASEGEEQVVPEITSYQLIDILSDNAARSPEFGPRSALYIPDTKVAVKTGTSNEFRDNWTIGFTPNILVATWVGNNDNKPMSGLASGITGAAPIWNKVMSEMIKEKGSEEFPVPKGLIKVKVCAVNGLLPCKGCPKIKEEYFVLGTEPTKHCSFPSPSDCQAKKKKMEEEGKSAEEIVKALKNCPLGTPSPKE